MSETLLVIIGVALLFFLLSRGGKGIGCCGGHSHHSSRPAENEISRDSKEKGRD